MDINTRSTPVYTIVPALCDEIAFWRSDDSANPDAEIAKYQQTCDKILPLE